MLVPFFKAYIFALNLLCYIGVTRDLSDKSGYGACWPFDNAYIWINKTLVLDLANEPFRVLPRQNKDMVYISTDIHLTEVLPSPLSLEQGHTPGPSS